MPVSFKTTSPALAIVATTTTVLPAGVHEAAPPPTIQQQVNLTLPGRLRVEEVLRVLKIGRTAFWKGIQNGMYPPPSYYEGRVPFWTHSTILKVIERGGACPQ